MQNLLRADAQMYRCQFVTCPERRHHSGEAIVPVATDSVEQATSPGVVEDLQALSTFVLIALPREQEIKDTLVMRVHLEPQGSHLARQFPLLATDLAHRLATLA